MRSHDDSIDPVMAKKLDRLGDHFESLWQAGQVPQIEELVHAITDPQKQRWAIRELVLRESELRQQNGTLLSLADWQKRFPQYANELSTWLAHPQTGTPPNKGGTPGRNAQAETPNLSRGGIDSTALWPPSPSEFTTAQMGIRGAISESSEGVPPGRFGDYELLTELGRGGMGIVFKARQVSADRLVALKVIRADRFGGKGDPQRREAIERFRVEAKAAARLQHENLVTVYDVGNVDEQPYYSMQYVEGLSLRGLAAEGLIDNRRAAEIILDVAKGVHAAHQHGILHRDLKPDNVLVEHGSGRAMVADFGLAKLAEERGMTLTGVGIGTPQYMPPEQAVDAGSVTVASDVYSLGATLYHLLTGQPPFTGDLYEVLRKVKEDAPASPRQLNSQCHPDLETLCLKCLEKDPNSRLDSAEELVEELSRFLDGRPILARSIGRTGRFVRWCRRNPIVAALATIAIGLLLAVLVIQAVSNARVTEALEGEQEERKKARSALHESLIRQAHALWLAQKPGWRQQTLNALAQAAQIQTDPVLTELAIQTLAGWDWAPLSEAELPQAGAHLAIHPDGQQFAVSAGPDVLLGTFTPEGQIAAEPDIVWSSPNGDRIAQLESSIAGDRWVWLTDTGNLFAMSDGERIEAIPISEPAGMNSFTFGPKPGQLVCTDGNRVQIWDFGMKEVIASWDWNAYSPQNIIRNNPSAKREARIRDATALLADPQGEFVVGSGARNRPTLWTNLGQTANGSEVGRELPTGDNLRMVIDPEGRYLYVACNEPRWGDSQIGGRLPPWAVDPTPYKSAVEPPAPEKAAEPVAPSEPDPDSPSVRMMRNSASLRFVSTEKPEEKKSDSSNPPAPRLVNQMPAIASDGPVPEASEAGVDSGGGFSKEPPPVSGTSADFEREARQTSSDVDEAASKQPPPAAAMTRGAESETTRPGKRRRPLSLLLSGPIRRVYLYQFEIIRHQPTDSAGAEKARVELRRIDPRISSESQIFRLGDVSGLAVTADGAVLVCGTAGEAVMLRPAPPRLAEVARVAVPHPPLRSIKSLGNGQRTVFCTGERSLAVWERQGLEGNHLLRPGLSDAAQVTAWSKVAISNTGQQIAVANWERMVEIRDLQTGDLRHDLPEMRYVRDLAWSADGTILEMVTPEDQSTLQLSPFHVTNRFNTFDNTLAKQSFADPIASIHLALPDWSAYGLRDAGVLLNSSHPAPTSGGEIKNRMARPQFMNLSNPTVVRIISEPGSGLLAAAASDGTIQIWDDSNLKQLGNQCLNGPRERWINDLAISPTTSEVVAATTDARLVILDSQGAIRDELECQAEALTLAIDGSGQFLICGGQNGGVAIWDLPRRKSLVRWIAHDSPTGCVHFEPHGCILTAGLSGEIRRWDLPTLWRQANQLGVVGNLSSLAFDWQASTPKALQNAGQNTFTRNAGVSPFPRPNPRIARFDPRRHLGRIVGDKVEMEYIKWLTVQEEQEVPYEVTVDTPDGEVTETRTRIVVVKKLVRVSERELFSLNAPLPDHAFCLLGSQGQNGPRLLDLADSDDWEAFASDGKTCLVERTVEQTFVGEEPTLKLRSESGFDTGVRLKIEPQFNLTEDSLFYFMAYSQPEHPWQIEQPVIVLRCDEGTYTFTPRKTPLVEDQWVTIAVPLTGSGFWRRTIKGSPNPAEIREIEIHHDTWDYGLTMYYDEMRFLPDAIP